MYAPKLFELGKPLPQRTKFAQKVHKLTLRFNVINFELNGFNASISVTWTPSDQPKMWCSDIGSQIHKICVKKAACLHLFYHKISFEVCEPFRISRVWGVPPTPLPPYLVYNQSSEYWIFKRYQLTSWAAKDLNCPFLPSALDQNLDKYSQKKVLSLIERILKISKASELAKPWKLLLDP